MTNKKTTVKFLQNVSVRGKRCLEGTIATLEDIIIPSKGESTNEIVLTLLRDFEDRKLAAIYDGEADEQSKKTSEAKNTDKNTGSGNIVLTEKTSKEQDFDTGSEYLNSLSMEEIEELYFQKFGESPKGGEPKKNLIDRIVSGE
jgi:hypothetical protein